MSIEEPEEYTPEEIVELEKSRTISDAELLKDGAEYEVSEEGEKENLLVTEKQKYEVGHELEKSRTVVNERIVEINDAAATLRKADFSAGEGYSYAEGLTLVAKELEGFSIPEGWEFSFKCTPRRNGSAELTVHTPEADIKVFNTFFDTFSGQARGNCEGYVHQEMLTPFHNFIRGVVKKNK